MAAHPTAGVPAVAPRHGRFFHGGVTPESKSPAPEIEMQHPSTFGPYPAPGQYTNARLPTATSSSQLQGLEQGNNAGTAFSASPLSHDAETALLIADLNRADIDFDQSFQRISSDQLADPDSVSQTTPVVYFTKFPMRNMKLKVTVVPQSEDEFIFKRPRTSKGALLMLKAQQEKQQILAELARVRAEHDQLKKQQAALLDLTQGGAAAGIAGSAKGGLLLSAETAARLERLGEEGEALEARINALTQDTQREEEEVHGGAAEKTTAGTRLSHGELGDQHRVRTDLICASMYVACDDYEALTVAMLFI